MLPVFPSPAFAGMTWENYGRLLMRSTDTAAKAEKKGQAANDHFSPFGGLAAKAASGHNRQLAQDRGTSMMSKTIARFEKVA